MPISGLGKSCLCSELIEKAGLDNILCTYSKNE
jgi:hypothetical protein